MNTKVILFDFPINENIIAREIDEYLANNYIISTIQYIPEVDTQQYSINPQLMFILCKYPSTIFSGPYTFNIAGDI